MAASDHERPTNRDRDVTSVAILLPSYNGARFLSACLDGLRAQTHPGCTLYVRDDGSSDATPQLLQRYTTSMPTMRLTLGTNYGIIGSFFALLSEADECAHYAFCDQDDVWLPGKIARAVSLLEREDPATPALYCSAVYLVNADLTLLGRSPRQRRGPDFGHALFQNIAQGCTMVINQAARQLVCETRPDAQHPIMFDWWLYLLISGAGTVIFDETPQVYYRQHAGNHIGTSPSTSRNRLRALQAVLRADAIARCEAQARELARCAQHRLLPAHRRELDRFLRSRRSLTSRVGYALTGRARRNTTVGTLVYRLASIAR